MVAPDQKPCIVAIMGCTGVGKSTFIRTIGGVSEDPDNAEAVVGDGLESCMYTDVAAPTCGADNIGGTAEPQLFRIPDTNVYLLDTPGFNDTNVSDREILRRISGFLADLHSEGTDISGVLYLHSIDEARMTGSAQKNKSMLRKIFGTDNLGRCVLVTTKWSRESPSKAAKNEAELLQHPNFWKPLLDEGVRYGRFEDTPESALGLLLPLCGDQCIVPKVVVEWSHDGKRLHETEAGRAVEDDVARAKAAHRVDIKEIKEDAEEMLRQNKLDAAAELDKERAELEAKVQQMEDEKEKLRITYEEEKQAKANKRTRMKRRAGRWAVRGTYALVGSHLVAFTGGFAAPWVSYNGRKIEKYLQRKKADDPR